MTMTAPVSTATHPLSRLSAAEFTAIRGIVADAGLVGERTKFVYVGLDEPHKDVVLAWQPGDPIERRARVLLLDRATGNGADLTVSITAGLVESNTPIDALVDGQVPILDDEFKAIEPILAADERWVTAMAKRGLDVANVRSVPLSAGSYFPDEYGHRIVRVLGFHQADPTDLPWAHPVDGVVAFVDVTRGVAIDVQDHFDLPVPAERAELTPDVVRDLKPIEITQPEGRSFTVDDDVIRWAGWEVRVGFDAREGLTLNQLSIDGRSVVHRASISEMVVPYADPSPVRFWQNYFDTGEYLFARYTNSLELGCDCLGEILYFDATLADETGNPRVIKNAICLHEEDYGVGWKHTDIFNGMLETRRSRRLVISFFTTIGNYDYGFYWYLHTDGTIALESKATGIVFTSAYRGEEHPFATEIAPGLGAPFHQHLFSARLDMAVDGVANTVHEVDAVRLPISETNPYGNAFTRKLTPLTTEKAAARTTDATVGRTWHVVNPSVHNRLGQPVGYALHPENGPTLLADDSSSVASRAAFSTKSLWVTAYDPAERYAAGDFVNQHPGDGGLPSFVADDAPVEDTDVVLWHTFGLTHFPRPEDWPVMPTDYAGFTLKPVGFFDRNPALGVPASTSSHCATGAGHCS
ncbi:primary-amine oxidase [Modestobacter marinus]|uniref:Amine oxidase n=1 Tax=Modestobacter marinus TaxID=477641 RepID=A0A846LPT5_9ACTN|nr:primary-amine oxidase [Modestobacter marinus]NIH68222.1 primary-amine oxidase [Modestobacter marinus]GGL79440.1 amine oxidase [Modestobacter marinus]